jgi:hypothetical protein
MSDGTLYPVAGVAALAVIVVAVLLFLRSRRKPSAPEPDGNGPSAYASTPGYAPGAYALGLTPHAPAREEPRGPSADPGAYASMPSGLSEFHGPEHAMPTGRPSGLPGRMPADPQPVHAEQQDWKPQGWEPQGWEPQGWEPQPRYYEAPQHPQPIRPTHDDDYRAAHRLPEEDPAYGRHHASEPPQDWPPLNK